MMKKAIGMTTFGGPEVLHIASFPSRMRVPERCVFASTPRPSIPHGLIYLLSLFLQRIWLPAVSKEGK